METLMVVPWGRDEILFLATLAVWWVALLVLAWAILKPLPKNK